MMMFGPIKKSLLLVLILLSGLTLSAQRTYSSNSVLNSGNWFKIATKGPGIYKIDLNFLAKLGINGNISTSSIRLFGNGGSMLDEKPGTAKIDDLFENAIWVEDGGDGILNGSDYLLFYAQGPNDWFKDSLRKSFYHRKNLYSEKSFYYINIGTDGKRIADQQPVLGPNISVSTYDARYFHELDTVNFLSSGKQWYGEEFSTMPGKPLTRSFSLPIAPISNSTGSLSIAAVARSFGSSSKLAVNINNQLVNTVEIPPVANSALDLFAQTRLANFNFTSSGNSVELKLDYTQGSFGSQAWLDYFTLNCRSNLSMSGKDQLLFRDWNSVAIGNVARFTITSSSAIQVWDITSPLEPIKMRGTQLANGYEFNNNSNQLREYIAFSNNNFLVPETVGRIPNQNLHNSTRTGFLIVTHSEFLAQANQLAQFHQQKDGLISKVVTVDQVYNEFSSGTPDPTAIRDFVKMYYDKAGNDSTLRPRYLLLFGDASFDYKSRLTNNQNLVPAFESENSLDPLSTYTSDDYFGLLEDGDDVNGNGIYLLDISIGRIPANTVAQAQAYVNKIINYNQSTNFGPWRNQISFVADDEDGNLHLQDAEVITNAANNVSSLFIHDKIYLDAFQQEGGSGGSRYPEVNITNINKLNSGTLIWNYSGHGGFRRLAEEVVLDQEIINNIKNEGRLPLFITATCDFAPYDNPLINSIGENLLLREKTGAIALMTTTRIVFAFSNRVINKNYLETALRKKVDSGYYSLGDAVKLAKNFTYTFSGDVINNRKFTLLGDPAFTIGFPVNKVITSTINEKPIGTIPDTVKALSAYNFSGNIADPTGNILSGFNGTVYIQVFDKPQTKTTLGNDPGSSPTNFSAQKNAIFRGKVSAQNGKFNVKFIVPSDIDYSFGNGRISYYADNGQVDANGVLTNIIVGGTGTGNGDNQGPQIKAYLNDEKFVNGSITNSSPLLILKLSDSSGINIIGNSIGHDLVAILDNDPKQTFILNNAYEADLDNYQKGTVRFQMPSLSDGLHSLSIKAWDVVNNSSETTLDFRVIKPEVFQLDHVLNYPNPFTSNTQFWFEHNRPGEELAIFIEIYTVSGKLVKTVRETIFSTGNRSNEVNWNGRDEYGSKLGRGVYIYRLRVRTSDGKYAEKWEKLYLL